MYEYVSINISNTDTNLRVYSQKNTEYKINSWRIKLEDP